MSQQEVKQKHFTEEQIVKYRRIFNLFDINKNGVLEARELAAVSKVLGYRLPKEQLFTILTAFDLDENGTLSFEEFLAAMPGNAAAIPEDEHRRAEFRRMFQVYDSDCNGFISKQEAQEVLAQELGFTKSKTESLLNQFDINEDGQLSYEEFVGFYLKVKEKKDAITKAFHHFDKENKGYVSIADAKRILGGMLFTEDEVETLVKTHDTNQDGLLQYEEFVHFWSA